MPRRKDIKKVLVIGSGPIVIGQAAEFDYAGTQACLALKEEGYEVILANSNPATIMTDTHIADKVYMEPLTLEYVAKIIRFERPDAIVPGLGGQTGLNLAVQLAKKGILKECQVEILGTSFESIERAEDRELFKELCESLGEPVLPSHIAMSIEEAVAVAEEIGYPVVLRPAFTLGGTGGGFADDETELREMMRNALSLSPVHQVLVEKSIKGYKEIEYEVMRDRNDTAICICCMENIDPVGIHTGDSIVVAPSQTLTNKEFQMLRDSALKIIRELKIEGGCNVQFALDPLSFKYYLIEVNPRVSRSSALASKASGYPIARVSAKIAVGLTLDEIRIANTPASFEPTLDYIVTKVARFPFDKFSDASNKLGTQMKATGEVMSIGRTMEESLLKAVRSLETGVCHIYHKKFDKWSNDDLLVYIKGGTDDRLYAIGQLIRNGVDLALIYDKTKIDMFFLEKFKNIVEFENVVRAHPMDVETLRAAKRMGFSDKYIGQLWGLSQNEMYRLREKNNVFPVYKMIDTCASEFASYVPYFYSTYEEENESIVSGKEKIIVLGSGPIRIGQGVEFDYSTVHAIWSIRAAGYEAIIINNNPETVSTDYTTSDKLYFEPLTVEDVMNVIHLEKPKAIVVSLGGQTAINLAEPLAELGVPIIGTDTHVGRDVQPKEMSSMGAIAKAVSGKTESYMGDRTCGELVEEFYPLIVDDILQNRQVNRDSLRPWLEDLKKIADNCGILPSRKEGRAANIWDLGSDVKLVLQETDGFNQAMTPYAVAELLNANVVSVENAFYPKMVIGINSRSEHVEIAKDFLRFALSEELQSVDTYEGFPVNAKALETQAAADRSMAEAYTTYDIDGSTAEFAIKAYSEETANHLMELCKAATLCLKEDTQIETSLTESLQAYLNGQASVEEAMDAVEGSLKMYLAE